MRLLKTGGASSWSFQNLLDPEQSDVSILRMELDSWKNEEEEKMEEERL
jgi:hypothetical protein